MSSWSDLQPDVLSLIKSRLLAGDLTTFNMICRPWRSIMPARSRDLLPPIDHPLAHTPCLVTLRNNVCEFYHPIYNAAYKVDTPELSGARIRSSGYGWLLLTQGNQSLFFFNPFTKEKIDLPNNWWVHSSPTINFSSPPTSPDCFVIAWHPSCPYEFSEFKTIKCGEAAWRYHNKNNGKKKFLMCAFCSPVFFSGKWYFLGETGNFGVYDIKKNRWHVFGKAWSSRKRASIHPTSLVVDKDGGGLLAVFLTHEHRHVHVMRFDLFKMMWEDVKSLGNDKMLYVSEGASYLETAIARGMGNKIYFPKFDRENSGVLYCLSTKKYRSNDGKYCNSSPFKLLEPRSSTWIKPVYTSNGVEELKW